MAIFTLIKRDLRLALRSGGAWAYGLVFMVFFLTLCALALGGNAAMSSGASPSALPLDPAARLNILAAPLIWLSILFSSLLSIPQIFEKDMSDGSTAQLKLAGVSLMSLASAKIISFTIIYLLPLVIAVPVSGQLFALSLTQSLGLCCALIIALPALAIYVSISGALLCARQSGGFLSIILTAPLLIPTLIFGVAASQAYGQAGLQASEFRILAGLSFIAIAIGLPAIAAALGANLEQG